MLTSTVGPLVFACRFVHSANALESSLEFRIAQVSEVLRPDAPREDVVGDEQRSVMDEAGDIPRGSIGSEQRGHREGPVNEKMVVAPRSDLLATGAVIVVVAALACGVALETRHDWLRTAWFACLLAPLGTWLRWQLAVRANYRAIAGRGSWFPWGTLIANMLGTALTAGMAALQLRGDLGYWGRILSGATADGFCGALTTVSTLVAEVRW